MICATNAEGVSERLMRLPPNAGSGLIVDRTDLCTVISQPLLIAGLFGCGPSMGQSPTLARTVRGWLSWVYRLRLGA